MDHQVDPQKVIRLLTDKVAELTLQLAMQQAVIEKLEGELNGVEESAGPSID